MIKNFTFSFLLLASFMGFSQGYDLPVTFDETSVTYGVVDFGGNGSEIVADPTDASNKVVKTTKGDNSETWAGTTIGIEVDAKVVSFKTKLPFTVSETKMTVRVWSPDANIPVNFKVEDSNNAGKSVETIAMTTKAGEWETLEFDFSKQRAGTATLDLAATYNKGSMFFDFDSKGTGKVYYWDDVKFGGLNAGPKKEQMNLPVTFEDTMVDLTVTSFGDMVTTIVDDPKDAMNRVAMSTKPMSSPEWAGVTASTPFGFKDPIPFTASEKRMTVKVYSPDADITVRLKVEDATRGNLFVEADMKTTKANEWEYLVFDFDNPVSTSPKWSDTIDYKKASLFFNFGVTGADAGEKTYYWDDLSFGDNSMVNVVNTELEGLTVYPNPTKDIVNINTIQNISNVKVYSTVGQQVMEVAGGSNAVAVDMTALKPGVYTFIIEVEGNNYSFRTIKE